jgi:hypothetical protein
MRSSAMASKSFQHAKKKKKTKDRSPGRSLNSR